MRVPAFDTLASARRLDELARMAMFASSRDPAPAAASPAPDVETTVVPIIVALSFCHLANDTVQSLLPAIYPMLKDHYGLTFTQIGLITFTFQVTASLLQPLVGFYTDRRPRPYSLAIGMGLTLVGLVLLSYANDYRAILFAASLIGIGSSIFHPEASRIAHLAAGRRHGFAQSLFQVGGNFGSSLGPLAAALVIVPRGQTSILWFTGLAGAGIVVLVQVGRWYQAHLCQHLTRAGARSAGNAASLPRSKIVLSLAILGALIFSKYFYLVSLTTTTLSTSSIGSTSRSQRLRSTSSCFFSPSPQGPFWVDRWVIGLVASTSFGFPFWASRRFHSRCLTSA